MTESVPTMDMVRVRRFLKGSDLTVIGPNCPGAITPGEPRVGIMPGNVFSMGKVGGISRSGTLVYETVAQLTDRGVGQSTCVGVGGDPVVGTTQVEALRMFNEDLGTEAVVLIGEIGGVAEQQSAEYIASEMKKPVVAFIAGATAPPGRRMGHAGAIIVGAAGTAAVKEEGLGAAGGTFVICRTKFSRRVLAAPPARSAARRTRLQASGTGCTSSTRCCASTAGRAASCARSSASRTSSGTSGRAFRGASGRRRLSSKTTASAPVASCASTSAPSTRWSWTSRASRWATSLGSQG